MTTEEYFRFRINNTEAQAKLKATIYVGTDDTAKIFQESCSLKSWNDYKGDFDINFL